MQDRRARRSAANARSERYSSTSHIVRQVVRQATLPEMKCAASPGGTVRYSIAARSAVNMIQDGNQAMIQDAIRDASLFDGSHFLRKTGSHFSGKCSSLFDGSHFLRKTGSHFSGKCSRGGHRG